MLLLHAVFVLAPLLPFADRAHPTPACSLTHSGKGERDGGEENVTHA